MFSSSSGDRYVVEFVGGPFDGFAAECPQLAGVIAMPVSRHILRAICGESSGSPSPPSSVAYYHLGSLAGVWRYVFAGTESPQHLQMEGSEEEK
jgi:hypothetical protein